MNSYQQSDETYLNMSVEVSQLLANARKLRSSANYAESVVEYRLYLCEKPKDNQARVELAATLFSLKNLSAAQQELDAVFEHDANHHSALRHQASLYRAQTQFEEALKIDERLLALHPDDLQIKADIAGTLRALARFEEAQHQLNRLLQKDPQHLWGLRQQAALYKAQYKFDAAITAYHQILITLPKDIQTHLDIIGTARTAGNVALAKTQLDVLLALEPGNIQGLKHKAGLLREGGFNEASVNVYRDILARTQDDNQTMFQLANALDELGDRQESSRLVNQLLATSSPPVHALFLKSKFLEEAGNTRAAAALLESDMAARINKFQTELWRIQLLARHALEVPMLASAIDCQQTYPKEIGPHLTAGSIARQIGKRAQALELFHKALALDPTRNDQRLAIAKEQMHLYLYAEAQQTLVKVPPDRQLVGEVPLLTLLINMSTAGIAAAIEVLAKNALINPESGKFDPGAASRLITAGLVPEVLLAMPLMSEDEIGNDRPMYQVLLAKAYFESGYGGAAEHLIAKIVDEKLGTNATIELAFLVQQIGSRDRLQYLLEKLSRYYREKPNSFSRGQIERLLTLCHLAGMTELQDSLFSLSVAAGDEAAIRPDILNQAMRDVHDGEVAKANKLVSDNRHHFLDAEIDTYRLRRGDALGEAEEVIAGLRLRDQNNAGLTLAEYKSKIRLIIDTENIDIAELELVKLSLRYPERDLVLLKAKLLRMNLQIEPAINILQNAVWRDALDEEAAVTLAHHLFNSSHPEDARSIVQQWLKWHPMSARWRQAQIDLHWRTSQSWEELIQVIKNIRATASPALSLCLDLPLLTAYRGWGNFDQANQMLEEFRINSQKIPLPRSAQLQNEIAYAGHLVPLARHEELRQLHPQLLARVKNHKTRDSLLSLAAINESFAGGSRTKLQAYINQRSNPRHQYHIVNFNPAFDKGLPPARVAILLHVFYPDMWPELKNHLHNMRVTKPDLYITLPRTLNNQALEAEIRAFWPAAIFTRVENRGFDIGAHWQALGNIELGNYDVAVLLQTKKAGHTLVGNQWRVNLLDSIASSSQHWLENLWAFTDSPQLGIIGSGLHRNSGDPWDYQEMHEILSVLGMPTRFDEVKKIYEHVSGTTFMIRASVLQEMYTKTHARVIFERYEELCLSKRWDRTYAHAMERVFGMYTRWKGFETLWRP